MKAVLDEMDTFDREALAPLYLYSYGLYTSFPVIGGKVPLFDRHLERLTSSSAAFFGVTCDPGAVKASLARFLVCNENTLNATVRVTLFPRDLNIGAPDLANSLSVLVTGRQGSSVPDKPLRLMPTACDRPLAQYKVTNIAAALHARAKAHKAGYDDALFLSDGIVSEGPTWNIFFVQGDRLVTPPSSGTILPGVMRQAMIDGFDNDVDVKPCLARDLEHTDAAFVTNAVIGTRAVAAIGEKALATDHPLIGRARALIDSIPLQTIG